MASVSPRRTKIVATIGPSSSSPEQLDALVAAGMDAARLNLSHGTHDDHSARAALVREAEERAGRPLALIGDLPAPMQLPTGEEITVVLGMNGQDGELPIAPAAIGDVLQPGHEVLIDDGLVRLRVDEVESGRATCAVVVGGLVSS